MTSVDSYTQNSLREKHNMTDDDKVEAEKIEKIRERVKAWDDLLRSLRKVRDLMLEDNGGSRERNPDDSWLAYMIGRVDELIGHWDPDASPEEVALADAKAKRPPHKHT